MEIKRSSSQPSTKGPTEYFTGNVRIDPLFQAAEPFACQRRFGDIRARRPHCMAYPSAWPEVDCHLGLRLDAVLGRPKRGNGRTDHAHTTQAGSIADLTTRLGPRTAAAEFVGTICPVMSQSNSIRMAASCCFTPGAPVLIAPSLASHWRCAER